jgi:hypothetical protein
MVRRNSGNSIRALVAVASALAISTLLAAAAWAREPGSAEDATPSDNTRAETAGEAATVVTGTVPSDLNNPDVDVVHVKCTAKTTICADVADIGFNDNTFHVAILCVTPIARRGQGELELAVAPGRPVSESACVTNCAEAFAVYSADFNDFSDSTYDSVVSCGAKPFAKGFPKFPQ